MLSGSYYELPETPEFFCGDVSTMAYTGNSLTPTGNTTEVIDGFLLSDEQTLIVADSAAGNPTIYEYKMSTVNDLSTVAYTGNSFDASAQFDTTGKRIHTVVLSLDGLHMYLIASDWPTTPVPVFEYSLSTANDITTASYTGRSWLPSEDNFPYSIYISDDGTKLIAAGTTNKKLYSYTLSTPFNLSTISYDGVDFDWTGQTTEEANVYVTNLGSSLYLVDAISNRVFQYSMTTPYDISTLSYTGKFFSTTAETDDTHGFSMNNTATRAYIADITSNTIYEYGLDCS